MSYRDRERKPGRKKPFREPMPIILIVCEGQITEPEYLRGFANDCRNPRVNIKIAPEHGVPMTLVRTAKDYQHGSDYDSVWCIFDVDDHPHLAAAQEMARANGISVAVSNPCIELWLLLHFCESPGMQARERIRELLKEHVPGYNKSIEYSLYAPGYLKAKSRAEGIEKSARERGDFGINPSTTVYQLTESIRTDEVVKEDR